MKTVSTGSGSRSGGVRFPGGQAPLGYARTARGRLARVGAEAGLVRTIFREYLRQKSLAGLMLRLSSQGLLNRGRPWTRQTLFWILRNPAYIGWVRVGAQVWRGAHPSIVSSDLFTRVQECLTRQCRNPNRGGRSDGRPSVVDAGPEAPLRASVQAAR